VRDDFSRQTLDVLAKRVGVRCSNPSCKKLTTGPRIESHYIVNIGVGAHITAASPGGPRFDSSFTPEQRQSADNGIWLCQNCAKLIDNDPSRYAVEILCVWKAQAEKAALNEIEGKATDRNLDLSAEIELSYVIEHMKSERHDYRLETKLTNCGIEPIGHYFVEVEMPASVMHLPQDNPCYIPDRSSRRIAFFRSVSENQAIQVYPGDTKIIFSINYYMDNDLFFHRGDLFKSPVRVKFYRHGLQPIILEKLFKDLQFF
jgi:hypothetical protein